MHRSPIAPFLMALACAACSSGDDGTGGAHELVIQDVAAPEGSSEQPGTLSFPVALSRASSTVSIDWSTRAGSAEPGVDFEPAAGTLTLAPGQREARITVALIGNDAIQDNRKLELVVDAVSGARPARANAVGTIADDDVPCTESTRGQPNPWFERRELNFAHRGGVIDFPENTLYAYKQAAALGAEVLEMDVYQTADNEIVVLHDLTVDRTTDGSGDVREMTLPELKALDAAHNFVPGEGTPQDAPAQDYIFRGIATGEREPPPGFAARDFRIPTLEEALAAFPDHLINVELKPVDDETGEYEARVAAMLKDYGRVDDVMVASFQDGQMLAFKDAAPCVSTSVPLGQAAISVLLGKVPLVRGLPNDTHQAYQVPIDTSSIQQVPVTIEVVNQQFIDDAHAQGLAVHVFTINDCPTMVSLLEMGVDAVMTDRPVLLEEVLRQPPASRSCEALTTSARAGADR